MIAHPTPSRRSRRTLLPILLVLPLLASCATWPTRPLTTASAQAAAHLDGYGEVRLWADAPIKQWVAWRSHWLGARHTAGNNTPVRLLAISSGSDKGAFAAGYLNAWTAKGNRPQFTIVTGVSTGALIAPFAFIGPDGDAPLKALYTGIRAKDVFNATPVSGVLGGASLASTKPLEKLIARYVTPALIDRIAAEHNKGRRLLVMTTNLDSGRGMVWDLGAIAASTNPGRVALIRKILQASASIPGAFTPVLIDTVSPAGAVHELHVDGGTTSSVFVLPSAVLAEDHDTVPGGSDRLQITLIYNGVLEPDYEVVKPRTFTIIGRALATVIGEADRQAVANYRRFASENNADICVAAIGSDFSFKHKALFNPAYMRALFDYGVDRGTNKPCTAE
jgi:hypothetical protein